MTDTTTIPAPTRLGRRFDPVRINIVGPYSAWPRKRLTGKARTIALGGTAVFAGVLVHCAGTLAI